MKNCEEAAKFLQYARSSCLTGGKSGCHIGNFGYKRPKFSKMLVQMCLSPWAIIAALKACGPTVHPGHTIPRAKPKSVSCGASYSQGQIRHWSPLAFHFLFPFQERSFYGGHSSSNTTRKTLGLFPRNLPLPKIPFSQMVFKILSQPIGLLCHWRISNGFPRELKVKGECKAVSPARCSTWAMGMWVPQKLKNAGRPVCITAL